jgi:hypothetical protein
MTEEVSKERLEQISRQQGYDHASLEKIEMARELLRLRYPTEARGEPVAWMAYWPGAGSVDSVTRVTRFEHSAQGWEEDGAEITPLFIHPPAREAVDEIASLKADLTRYIDIATKEATEAEGLRATLRMMRCPRPCNHRPDEFDAGECIDAGECGCIAGAAIRSLKQGERG